MVAGAASNGGARRGSIHPPQYDTIEQYVRDRGGSRVIKKVLIANNGIGAVKAIRSMRRWAYETFGNERAIQFVVMATPEDMRANAEYIRMADEVVDVPGGSNNNNYANVLLIVEIGERWNVDAVWAGWGHASENPFLPNSLAKSHRNIAFIGPSGAPMQALGDKIGSTIIAQSAAVPTISWNGDGLTCNYKDGGVPQELYDKANVSSGEACLEACCRIGFPVMIKASEGGGGKGIRKVEEESQVIAAYRQVASEIPGSPVFVMKLAPKSRHLEVQLLADMYGQAIALNGRDCSIQRRHQKIIEEGPPVAAPPDVWKAMERAAISLAKEVGYCNAGTVEYLYLEDKNEFYFLELNPRLQVEHPVTEMITRVNLPAAQLQVSMGIPLHMIPDIRLFYGVGSHGSDEIDFDNQERISPANHCIAVRITAENPDQGFQPTSGSIQELNFRSTPDVWGYFSVDGSGLVHEFADSQFGHLFAAGADREAARKNMIIALKELSIRGDIRTTVEYIVHMMQSEDFTENRIDTAWLDRRILDPKSNTVAGELKRGLLDVSLVVTVGAVVTAYEEYRARSETFCEMLGKGLLPQKNLVSTSMEVDLIYEGSKYSLRCSQSGPKSLTIYCNEAYVQAECRGLSDGGYLVVVGSKSHAVYANWEASGLRVVISGSTAIFTKEYDPTTLDTEVAGKLARCLVPEGTHLNAGEPYAEMEVMKMYMPLTVQEAGTVHWVLSEGAALKPGDQLGSLALDDPSSVTKAELFTGHLTVPGQAEGPGGDGSMQKPLVVLRKAITTLEMVLWGYEVPEDQYTDALENLKATVCDPMLPLAEFEEALSVLSGRIEGQLFKKLSAFAQAYRAAHEQGSGSPDEFPAHDILPVIDEYGQSLAERDRAAYMSMVESLRSTIQIYTSGVAGRTVYSLLKLVRLYLTVERSFTGGSMEDCLQMLRKTHSSEHDEIFSMCRSHCALEQKNRLLLTLLEDIHLISAKARATAEQDQFDGSREQGQDPEVLEAADMSAFVPVLTEISNLPAAAASRPVAAKARSLLIQYNTPSRTQRRRMIQRAIQAVVNSKDELERLETIGEFLEERVPMRDLLIELFAIGQDPKTVAAAIELYLRFVYTTHNISGYDGGGVAEDGKCMWAKWTFTSKGGAALPSGVSSTHSFVDLKTLARSISASEVMSDVFTGGASDTENSSEATVPANVSRHGVFMTLNSMSELAQQLPILLRHLPQFAKGAPRCVGGPVNAVHIVVLQHPHVDIDEVEGGGMRMRADTGATYDDKMSQLFERGLSSHVEALRQADVRRVTLVVANADRTNPIPSIYTYRDFEDYREDPLFRHIEPSQAYYLDLNRLSNFSIRLASTTQETGGNIHLYQGKPKLTAVKQAGLKGPLAKRYFARVVAKTAEYWGEGKRYYVEKMFVEALNFLDLAVSQAEAEANTLGQKLPAPSHNHIFIHVVGSDHLQQPDAVAEHMRQLMLRFKDTITRLGVTHFEMKSLCRLSPVAGSESEASVVPVRLVASNNTGYVVTVVTYVEVREGAGKGGEWEGRDVNSPYPVTRPFEGKRSAALLRSDTLYCFDFLELFHEGVKHQWEEFARERPQAHLLRPSTVMHASELVVVKQGASMGGPWSARDIDQLELREVSRPAGLNDVGMVAWLVTLRTPEYPEGRQLVIIANDITYKAGSFGTREDAVFLLASRYAREKKIARLYLAANSGARIGLAESLKAKFKVAWQDPEDPSIGYKYVYLEEADYADLAGKGAVRCQRLVDEASGEVRYQIHDIVGEESDLGVENLQGSGMIAGETSLAYQEVFTLTLVVGRTVGIGAYLVRLGQRTIQNVNNAPIILTGCVALNTLMGKEVYASNDQLGGPMVMHPNGVSHLLAEDHMAAVSAALRWLSYVPRTKGAYLPVVDITGMDMVERSIGFAPQKGAPYDPRKLIAGFTDESDLEGQWVSGFFDRGSFTETLCGWAETVVTGRARLGGIPMGVIVTESRMREKKHPADPADLTSHEKLVQQAGGVWFPDSAHKTAQAINDLNGEGLPLIIFANWRGFSGGMRDMFDEVLKYGALIVDALVAYKQPTFVYIPPFAELRGGAWVVIDSTINPDVMEMYAAQDSRGGVLEPNGAASIKYREPDLLKTAHRLDPVLQKLDAQLRAEDISLRLTEEERGVLLSEVKARELRLLGVYQQLAVHFADLHDTPGRMVSTGAVRAEVPWVSARSFFYWRLRRRLAEFDLRKALVRDVPSGAHCLSPTAASSVLKRWFTEMDHEEGQWEDDKVDEIKRRTEQMRAAQLSHGLEGMLSSSAGAEAAVSGLLKAMQGFDKATRRAIVERISAAI